MRTHVLLVLTLLSLCLGCSDSESEQTNNPNQTSNQTDQGQARDMSTTTVTPDMNTAGVDMFQGAVDMSAPDMAVTPQDLGVDMVSGEDAGRDEDMAMVVPDMAQAMDMNVVAKPVDVKVATFNVELLFDQNCDSGDCGPDRFEKLPTNAELADKVLAIQQAITKLDADVLMLQEIETEAMMELLAQPFMNQYKTRVFGATSRKGSIHVAILSRGKFLEEDRHRGKVLFILPDGSRQRFAREFLEVQSEIRGARVIAFSAHFISKSRPSNDFRRLEESTNAARIAVQASKDHPGSLVVIGGDLNDTPDSATLQAMKSQGMVITAENANPQDSYTNKFGVIPQIIDHIVYVDTGKVSVVPGTRTVTRDPAPNANGGLAGSDHAAPSVTLKLTP